MFRIKLTQVPGDSLAWHRELIGNTPSEFSQIYDDFMKAYAIKRMIVDDELHKRPLIDKKDRICRFCKSHFSETEKFKSLAHLIPALIGNRNLFSDFECDQCNSNFSKLENDLANFIGAARPFTIVPGRSGKLKFKSPDKTFIVERELQPGTDKPKLRIESHEIENLHFTINEEEKMVTFHTTRPTYTPFNVYRAFLKMGLSLIPEKDAVDYSAAISIARHGIPKEDMDNPWFKMNMYHHPGPAFPSPMLLLFEKKDSQARLPKHICCIMFQNYTYQLVMPYNEQDRWMEGGSVTFMPMPPFIDKHFANAFGLPKNQRLNFNMNTPKKNEKHDLTFSFDTYTEVNPS